MKEIDSSQSISGVQKVQGLESVSQKEENLKHDLVTYILANMLHETVQKHLEANATAVSLPKPTLGAAAPTAGLGAEPPLPPLPPDSPTSPYDSSVPPTERLILEKIDAFIESLQGDPSNPATLEKFIAFISNLSQQPGGLTAKETQLLNAAGSGISNLIGPAMEEMIIIQFFENGEGAAQTLMNNLRAFFGGIPNNPFIQSMINGINGFNLPGFAADHQNGHWNMWGYDLNWNDPDDRETMLSYIFNIGPDGTPPNSFFDSDNLNINAFSREYRLMQIDDMIAAAHGNPDKLMILLSLWFMKDADDRANRQEAALAHTINLLSKMTNKYMTPILNKIKSIGPDFTGKDAKELADLYIHATIIMNSEGKLSSLAEGWNKNTVEAINGIMVPDPRGGVGEVSIGTLFQAFKNGQITQDELAKGLKSLVPTPPAGGEPSSSTSPGYQALFTAMESGGGLVTGMSKQVSTQLTAIVNLDNAILKFGHTIADSTGGGIAQLMTKIVGNQISR